MKKAALKKIFDSNKEKNEIHTTSDGIHFFERQHAVQHAKNLTDKSITSVTREECMLFDSKEEELAAIEARMKEIEKIFDPYKEEVEAMMRRREELLNSDEGKGGDEGNDDKKNPPPAGDEGTDDKGKSSGKGSTKKK